jgi:hypothetical protein
VNGQRSVDGESPVQGSALPLRSLGRCGLTAPAMGMGVLGHWGTGSQSGLPMGWSSGPDDDEAVAALRVAHDVRVVRRVRNPPTMVRVARD